MVSEGLIEESQCTPCLGGYYCPSVGMVTPVDFCEAGFFCKQGANISAPDQGDDANICPMGHYCPLGTSAPQQCAKGTYNNGTGLQSSGDCIDCPAGEYCDQMGMILPAGLCSPSFYCEIGSINATSIVCPIGHYCPEGSPMPTPCPRGTYTNAEGNSNVTQCDPCDPGWYCNDTGLHSPTAQCDPGFYCPGGDDVANPVDTPCPIGLHCPLGSGIPVPCESGFFTNLTQMDECLLCPAGFYCVPEEVIEGNSSAGHRLCPRGYYCEAGTGRNWTACPPGTYSNELGLTDITECTDCTGGQYCDASNLTAPAGNCDPGYYCTRGVDTATPSGGHTGTGGVCPVGHYCLEATTNPEPCEAGSYQVRKSAKTRAILYYILSIIIS
jgi:hypothetical protein